MKKTFQSVNENSIERLEVALSGGRDVKIQELPNFFRPWVQTQSERLLVLNCASDL